MSNYQKLYWLTRLDNIQNISGVILLVIAVLFVVFYIGRTCSFEDEPEEYNEKYGKFRLPASVIGIIFALILTFLPSRNEMTLICAGGKTMDYVQTDTSLSKIPYQTTAIISQYLERQLKETEKK